MTRPRVFGIGLNKTGTVSLHQALTILGYSSIHFGGLARRTLIRRAMAEGRPLLDHLEPDVEAISDLEEITYHFDLVDRQYPGSRFVLTVRDLGAWLDSRRRHVEKNRQNAAAGTYHGTFLDVDMEGWTAEHRAHDTRVRAYFAGRPDDLLVYDLAGGAGWEPLCSFLGLVVPDVPFPWENRYRPAFTT